MHPGYYVLIAFVIIVVLGFFWGRKLDKSKESVYIDFAHKYKLDIQTDDLQKRAIHITGKLDGRDFELKEEVVGNSQDPSVWTYLRFKETPFDFDFQITCESTLMKLAKSLGYEDVKIGNPDFDKKFVCHAKDTAKMKKLFDEKDQQHFLNRYDDIYGMFENKLAENKFEYVHQGRINRPFQMEELERILQFMREIVENG